MKDISGRNGYHIAAEGETESERKRGRMSTVDMSPLRASCPAARDRGWRQWKGGGAHTAAKSNSPPTSSSSRQHIICYLMLGRGLKD